MSVSLITLPQVKLITFFISGNLATPNKAITLPSTCAP